MKSHWHWENGISHQGDAARRFIQDHFGEKHRHVLLIGGAGFDPRALAVSHALLDSQARLRVFLIQEVRSRTNRKLGEHAQQQTNDLREIVPELDVAQVQIFAEDTALIGGREAVRAIKNLDYEGITDVVVDFSALSLSVAFPIVRYLFELNLKNCNLHVLTAVSPSVDASICPTSSDIVECIHGFKGNFGLDESRQASCLWLPQLTSGRENILRAIFNYIEEYATTPDVCPLLPFPSQDPRLSDNLLAEYRSDLQGRWETNNSNIVYASEDSPLDVYRSVLRMRDERVLVFQNYGGSQIVLSPMGGKASAIGMLLAAIEGNFPVVYVEALNHTADYGKIKAMVNSSSAKLTHVWLQGEVYTDFNR